MHHSLSAPRLTGLVALVAAFGIGCKTTKSKVQESEPVAQTSFANDADREEARQRFKSEIKRCIPLVSAVLRGGRPLTLDKPADDKVIDLFTSNIVKGMERADNVEGHAMIAAFYAERSGNTVPCAGKSVEYAITKFAVGTNIIYLVLGETKDLQLSSNSDGENI